MQFPLFAMPQAETKPSVNVNMKAVCPRESLISVLHECNRLFGNQNPEKEGFLHRAPAILSRFPGVLVGSGLGFVTPALKRRVSATL